MRTKNFGPLGSSRAAILMFGTLLGFSALISSPAASGQSKPKAAPAPKPAAPSRPAAAPARPSGPSGGAAKPGGPTTGKPSTATSNKPTTSNPTGGKPTTSNPAGGKPTTATTAHPGSTTGSTTRPAAGANVPKGSQRVVAKNGAEVTKRANGRVADVHDAKRGMDIHHGLDGSRRVSVERHDGSRLVAERGRPGYVQRGYNYHGHDFAHRSYYYNGRHYDRYYRGYGYRGVYLNVYAPAYYYNPGFYGWAYNPWAVPVAYGWGWGGSPWLGFYGGYFSPYAVYPSSAFWLTDYIISQDLQAAYAARAAAQAGAADDAGAPQQAAAPTALTPEVKQMIADEVKNQIALENAEAAQTAQKVDVDPASSGVARLLADGKPHMFVAGGGLDVMDSSSGSECHISDGDALELVEPPPPTATVANLVVKASKGGVECVSGAMVQVNLTDLQEMQNHMRENIDAGLKELQAKQGQGGLPKAPGSAQGAPTQPEFAAIAPPPNPQDEADIKAQAAQADQAESEAQGSGTPAPNQ
jgi:hypothetical protein